MLVISQSAMNALELDTVHRLRGQVTRALVTQGADEQTARLCADKALDVGLRYHVTDLRSLISLATLAGTIDRDFDRTPAVIATLGNWRVAPSERVRRILDTPVLMSRIRARSAPGDDRRLIASGNR